MIMGFKEFLKEQPHFVGLRVICPLDHVLDGSDIRYMFDYGFEFLKGDKTAKEIELNFQQMKGRIPVFCRRHNLFYIWDFDANSLSSPINTHENKMIEIAKQGILKNAQDKKDKRVQTEIKRSTIFKGK